VLWQFSNIRMKETREYTVREAEKVMPSGALDTKTVEREVPRRVVAVLSHSDERDEREYCERSRKSVCMTH